MSKLLVFDMDGTIADFYSVPNWLEYLHNEDTLPYRTAKPLYDMVELNNLLLKLKTKGYTIAVTSWTAKNGTSRYNKAVRSAKVQWLNKHNFPYDVIHVIKYGKSKSKATQALGGCQVLIDDNSEVRREWKNGFTIDATKDILQELKKFL